jgi:(R,R)-butanediol dehydrogenase/meso-butanediol dehydrogenase/diacetyl reductase
MKALRYYASKDVRLENVPEPEPGADEVKIKIKWCGICGSDIHEYEQGPISIPTKKPHPGTGKMAPLIIGHEFSGDIVKTGSNVKSFKPGDRVAVRPTLPCYRCYYCKQGKHIQCVVLGLLGGSADGGFAEYVAVPADNVYKLPAQVSYEAAAYAEPIAVGVHAVKRSQMIIGDTVAIIGAGPIGLLTMQAARAGGAGKAIVFEILPQRAKLARELGATAVINPKEKDPGKAIAELTDGKRADIAFECVGSGEALVLADTVSGRGSKIIQVGALISPVNFSFFNLFWREKSIITSQGYVDEYSAAIAFLADGRIKCDPLMTTAKIRLEDTIEKGFKELVGPNRADHCKILVSPDMS